MQRLVRLIAMLHDIYICNQCVGKCNAAVAEVLSRTASSLALEELDFVKAHLEQLRLTLNNEHATICTIWVQDDLGGEKVEKIGSLLHTLFGAYLCGPSCSISTQALPPHQSFGFWNQELIEHARRVFPLPDGLQPGRPIYHPPLPQECWPAVERAYNKRPSGLPGHGLF